jgi:hypothetical protein
MNTQPWILLTLIGLALLVGLAAAYQRIQRILRIRRTPTCMINALPYDGEVEIAGTVGVPVSQSPITRTECAYWQVEVKEERSSGKSRTWHTIFKQSSDVVFQVQDGTGYVSVLPTDAVLVLNDDFQKSSGFLNALDAETLAAVQRLGVETTGFLGLKKSLKVTEKVIVPGDSIYVLGQVDTGSGTKVIQAAGRNSLIISDRSEQALLSGLYLEVALMILGLPAVIGLVVLITYLQAK